MSTCNRLDIESLGSRPTMSENFLGAYVGVIWFLFLIGPLHLIGSMWFGEDQIVITIKTHV